MSIAIDHITPQLETRLRLLAEFLRQVTRGFENLAEEIDHPSLSTAMRAISVECKQYAKEITNQFKQIPFEKNSTNDDIWLKMVSKVNKAADEGPGSEIAVLCSNCETQFNQLYSEVLACLSPEHLSKDLISFQLYAVNCALMKIKLLNHSRFEEQNV